MTACDGIAVAVEPRRPDTDAHAAWQYGNDSTPYTTLSRQAHAPGEIPRRVIESTGQQQCIKLAGLHRREHPLAIEWIDTLISQKGEAPGQLHAVHRQRAAMKVG